MVPGMVARIERRQKQGAEAKAPPAKQVAKEQAQERRLVAGKASKEARAEAFEKGRRAQSAPASPPKGKRDEIEEPILEPVPKAKAKASPTPQKIALETKPAEPPQKRAKSKAVPAAAVGPARKSSSPQVAPQAFGIASSSSGSRQVASRSRERKIPKDALGPLNITKRLPSPDRRMQEIASDVPKKRQSKASSSGLAR